MPLRDESISFPIRRFDSWMQFGRDAWEAETASNVGIYSWKTVYGAKYEAVCI